MSSPWSSLRLRHGAASALGGGDFRRRLLLALCIILSGGSLIFPRVPLLLVVIGLCLWLARGGALFRRSMGPVFVLLATILFITLLRPEGLDVNSAVTRFANFVTGMLLLGVYLRAHPGALRRDLYVLLGPMVWQALLTVILGELAGFLFVTIAVNDTIYHTVLLVFNYHVTLEESTALIRPDGFFYEPGVLQVYLNIFLYLALFVFRKRWQSLFATLAILSTQSTTGVIVCALILVGYFMKSLRGRRFTSGWIIRILLAVLVLVPVMFVVAGNITQKFTGESQGSFWARQYDLITGLNVVAENPLLGIGFDYEQYHRAAARLGYDDTPLSERITADRSNTNGIVFLLYSIGIPLAIPFLVGMFRQLFFENRALIGLLLLLSLSSESMIFTPFFLMLVFSGLLARSATHQAVPDMAAARRTQQQ